MKNKICLFFGLILVIPSVIVLGPMDTETAREIFFHKMHLSEMGTITLLVFTTFIGALLTGTAISNMKEKIE